MSYKSWYAIKAKQPTNLPISHCLFVALSFLFEEAIIILHLQIVVLSIYIILPINIVLEGRVFPNGPEDQDSIPGHVILKTLKTVRDTSLLNTQQYKVHIKSKVEQSRERSFALPYTLVL